jgi:hypothetical protein
MKKNQLCVKNEAEAKMTLTSLYALADDDDNEFSARWGRAIASSPFIFSA